MTETRESVAGGAFLGRGFRPFFALTGIHAVASVGLWLGVLQGVAPLPRFGVPFEWHAHEMLFGFAGAAIAGFLLTSVPVWTNTPALTGTRLAAIALVWLAGRVLVACAGALPAWWVAGLVDAAFFLLLALAIGPAIFRNASRRNYVFPGIALVFASANGVTHFAVATRDVWLEQAAMRLAIGCTLVLITILGGRLVPLFTSAALKRAGRDANVRHRHWADVAAAPLLFVFVVADTGWPGAPATGVLALAAALAILLRTTGWRLRAAFSDPLLWSMHLAYLWLPIGLFTIALTSWGDDPNATTSALRNVATHALTVGAIGGMILAIMTRVALGHTGRPFVAPRGISLAYLLVGLAALARTAGLLLLPAQAGAWLIATGVLWMGAFALFLWVYLPFLLAPRVDGRPG